MQLRYYAPHPSRHKDVLNLLKKIKEERGIQYQIANLTSEEGNFPLEEKEKRHYEKEFIPQASDLKRQTGSGIRKVLRSKSGGHYHLAGTIAIVENARVKYFVSPFDPRKREMLEYDKDIRLGFLKMVLDEGKEALRRFLKEPALEKTEEERLIHRFIDSGILKGEFEVEVRVGKRRMKYAAEKAHSTDLFVEGEESGEEPYYYRRVDAICDGEEATWVLEAKKDLNNQVIGQVLVSDFLYREDFPEKETKKGIICQFGNDVLEECCQELGITVFVEGEGAF
ncbi:MAG: hypothetical protein GWO20_20800 [Candidatus Korarchaeota archaeon]|nr:hypothetical protein [Candidatus Korarchaeota archaeon]NIU85659.1 hypothetical protein [Candidatus Thorarchaeota archaeon]NIW15760.1 hypothetical protein [Candidatus Thorarchaeota archaeon]NIW53676.1 hypothetical protein [Candidatus Korarchaeota archaeon]